MRFDIFGWSTGLVLALAAAVNMAYHDRPPPPVVVVLAVPPAAVPAAVPAPPPPSAPQLAITPAPKGSDLPTIVVTARPVHEVPEDGPPLPRRPIVLRTSDGRIIDPNETEPVAAPAVVRAPEPALDGPARAASATTLLIDGRTVRLFGVRPADARDRCSVTGDASAPCADIARNALAVRLAGKGAVRCHMPAGQSGDPGFVCHDASGTDLGGFLVAEGYARADTKSSYSYFGAEGVARTFHRGLWRYR